MEVPRRQAPNNTKPYTSTLYHPERIISSDALFLRPFLRR
nr:MAG TPA: hypothetical protein [Caudoviricetes sp.]